jgi:DNA-binding beta-propeller fold protein YncE
VSVINTSTLGSTSPYGFAFNSAMNVAYIADSDAFTTSSGFGGIEKWAFNGTTWAFQYSLPTVGVGADGVAVNFSTGTVYATSGDGTSLFDVVDTGVAGTSTTSLLDTAPSNEAFRGLTFAPAIVPEPSVISLLGLGISGVYWQMRRNRKS